MKFKLIYIVPILLILVAIGIFGYNSDSIIDVENNDLKVVNYTYNNTTYCVKGFIQNTGSSAIEYVPIKVLYYRYDGELMATTNAVIVNLEPNETKEFNAYYDETDSRYYPVDSFKIVVADPNMNVTRDFFYDLLEGKIKEYSKSKGADNSSIVIKGTPVDIVSDIIDYSGMVIILPEKHGYEIPLNQRATIFLKMDEGGDRVGTWVTSDGQAVGGYKQYWDVVAVYWPEMKIAGWHRVYGSSPNKVENLSVNIVGHVQDFNGDYPKPSDWINSLPKES